MQTSLLKDQWTRVVFSLGLSTLAALQVFTSEKNDFLLATGLCELGVAIVLLIIGCRGSMYKLVTIQATTNQTAINQPSCINPITDPIGSLERW